MAETPTKPDRNIDLSYPRSLAIFKEYLEKRRENIAKDLDLIENNYGIKKEVLENIRTEIREVLGGQNIEYLSTTIHLRPRAVDYLRLGYERINQAMGGKEKVFHYPVYYQEYIGERPDLIYIGNYSFSLCNIIPGFKKKVEEGEFKISLDFHLSLMEYLSREGWQEEIEINLEKFLNKEFSSFKGKHRNVFIEETKEVVISILNDYKEFITKSGLSEIIENIVEKNSKLALILLNNYEDLKPVLETVNIKKEYLEDIKEERVKIITSSFIFIICILGNLVHIGAEYGKFNQEREKLSLGELLEPEKPQERFRFFELEGGKNAESDTMRFLFGEDLKSFIQASKYEGLEEVRWSPINEKIRNRIRVIDFYFKAKEFLENKGSYLETVYLDSKKFLEIIEKINYFEHLKEEEKKDYEKIKEEINKEKKQKTLEEWVSLWNTNVEQLGNNRLKLIDEIFLQRFLIFVFENYVKGQFREIAEILPKEFYELFLKEGIEKLVTENIEDKLFYGLETFVKINALSKEDIIKISSLLKIAKENFEKNVLKNLWPF